SPRLSLAHATVLELWRSISADWRFASERTAVAFRQQTLSDEQKGEIVETLHGMLAHYRRLDFALECGGADRKKQSGQTLLTAWLLLNGKIDSRQAADLARGIDWDRVANIDQRIAAIGDPVTQFAIKHSLPDGLAGALVSEYPNDA